MTIPLDCDVCVVGGGLAGLSVAAELAASRRVVVLEREAHFAVHATGRSAALFAPSYGNTVVRALTRASRGFYLGSHEGVPLTTPRGALFVAMRSQADQLDALELELRGVASAITLLDEAETLKKCPALLAAQVHGSLWDEDARDIDVGTTVAHYVRRLRELGGVSRRDAEVIEIRRDGGRWILRTPQQVVHAPVVVNASGAWADEVATRAGIVSQQLQPMRRTALRVQAGQWDCAGWPCVIDVDEQWYFRPDAGALLLSPADETPSVPCDAQADDYDVAVAIDRVESVTQLRFGRPLSVWAGLRTFAPDRSPVVGFDAHAPGFYWLAGQGGYGIQMAPALARLAAAQILDQPPPVELVDQGVDTRQLAPRRHPPGA